MLHSASLLSCNAEAPDVESSFFPNLSTSDRSGAVFARRNPIAPNGADAWQGKADVLRTGGPCFAVQMGAEERLAG